MAEILDIMPNKDITLFVPVRNGLPYINDCVKSIRMQSFQDWQLVIVDNLSNDGTEEACREYLSDHRIRYVRNDSDLGMIGNFNRCLDLCDSKYYALLSHDDRYDCADAVAEAYRILESDSDISAVYSHINWIDEVGETIMTRRFRRVGKVQSDAVALDSIVTCRNLFGVPILARRSRIEGKRYEQAFYHTADIELSIATGRGASNFVIDRPCYAIRFHRTNGTMRSASNVRPELSRMAVKYGIPLSRTQKLQMRINEVVMRVQRRAFYTYLDHFRRVGRA